jgi:hypothetical protein
MTGLGGNCCAQLERGLPPGDVLATLNFFGVFFGQKQTSDVVHYTNQN